LSEVIGGLACHIKDFIGETVTIYTTSGGESGEGFTGVVLKVSDCFVRLITRIGPAPGCALGSDCDGRRYRGCYGRDDYGYGGRGYGGYGRNLGSVVDIPIDKIAAFVHNAV